MKLAIILAITALFMIASADVRSESLAAHNKYRKELGIRELIWSTSLENNAQTWADFMAKNRVFYSSKNRVNIGENIGYSSTLSSTASRFINRWGAQKDNFLAGEDYPYCTKTGNSKDIYLYSQMIWENTTEVGCAMASGRGRVYIVCQYSPKGNVRGEPVYGISNPEDSESDSDGGASDVEEPTKPEVPKPEQPKPEQPKPEQPKPEQPKPEQPKPEQPKPEQPKPEQPKPEQPKPEQPKPEQPKPEQPKPEQPQPNDPFIADSLNAHNKERNAYGVPSLRWSTTLAKSAQAYADHQARTGTTSHSTGRKNVGENLAWGSGNTLALAGRWLDERKYFIRGRNFPDCSNTGNWKDVAHYTAIMWRKTTEVGCGMGRSSSGRNYYVCHYSPAGNMRGQPVF